MEIVRQIEAETEDSQQFAQRLLQFENLTMLGIIIKQNIKGFVMIMGHSYSLN